MFRGKRVDTGEWAYGSLVRGVSYYNGGPVCFIYNPGTDIDGRGSIDNYDGVQVIPETVGQYIGVCDTNGNKIFEGDVLQEAGIPIQLLISYTDSSFCYSSLLSPKYKVPINDHRFGLDCSYLEIVGNIHDNPELLAK